LQISYSFRRAIERGIGYGNDLGLSVSLESFD